MIWASDHPSVGLIDPEGERATPLHHESEEETDLGCIIFKERILLRMRWGRSLVRLSPVDF